MFGWIKNKKEHIHKFKEKNFTSVVTLYEIVRFEKCRCGLERIKHIHYQGESTGLVEIEYIDKTER